MKHRKIRAADTFGQKKRTNKVARAGKFIEKTLSACSNNQTGSLESPPSASGVQRLFKISREALIPPPECSFFLLRVGAFFPSQRENPLNKSQMTRNHTLLTHILKPTVERSGKKRFCKKLPGENFARIRNHSSGPVFFIIHNAPRRHSFVRILFRSH